MTGKENQVVHIVKVILLALFVVAALPDWAMAFISFAGAAILLLSDLIASSVMTGVILPIGAITSLVGAPVFLYLLMK